MRTRTRLVLAAASIVVIAANLYTVRRLPTPYPDVQLYASIARAVQLYGTGVPTILSNSPTAVDHVPFYGPVFFDLAAVSLKLFGVRLLSFRLVSLLGAAVFLGGVALLARELAGSRGQWLWAVTLMLLAPELTFDMSGGAMHILAIGFQFLGLAVFTRALQGPPATAAPYAAGAGVLLGLAALTTPRSYLFLAAFLVTGAIMLAAPRRVDRRVKRLYAAAVIALGLVVAIWATISHGNPVRWARYMSYIFLHEDTDVAVLPGAVRIVSFSWLAFGTPAAAFIGAGMAVWAWVRAPRDARPVERRVAMFCVVTALVSAILNVVFLNYTFTNGDYWAVPLLAVVLALPVTEFHVPRRVIAVCLGTLIVYDAVAFGVEIARAAATWAARDPEALNTFVQDHVPPGSAVVGPQAPFFFPVERSGSAYYVVDARSWGDWARWVPEIEPDAVTTARLAASAAPAAHARFFIWPIDDDLPGEYACARRDVAGVFWPSPEHLDMLGIFGHPEDVGYTASVLYRLPVGCPTGYDPTARRAAQ